MIKSITGKSSWRTAPATTLEAAKAHADDTTRHLTAAERTAWNAKETTGGAQAKADTVQTNLTAHTGNNTVHVTAAERTTWNAKETPGGAQTKADAAQAAAATDASTKANAVQTNLTAHAGNTTVHISAAERTAWNAKADASQLGRVDLTQTLGPGLSVVTADQNGSELDLTVSGRTLMNLIGNSGDGESLAGWSLSGISPVLDTTRKRSGGASYKFAATSASASVMVKDITVPLDITKYYVALAWVYIESYASGGGSVMHLRDIGTATNRYSSTAATATIGSWQLVYIKIPNNNTLVGSGFRFYLGHTSANDFVFNMDDVRLYEVTSAEYAAIGTTLTGEAIDAYFPHVSGKQHVQGVAITKQGRNLIPGSSVSGIHANLSINGPYDIVLAATAADQASNIIDNLIVKGNTTYTFSINITATAGQGRIQISEYSVDGSPIKTASTTITSTFTWTTDSNTSYVLVRTRNTAAGTITYKNWQLELGSTATTFTPAEPQSVIIPVTLGQVGDVRDSVYSAGTEWMYVERVKKNVDLNGTQAWGFYGTGSGFKNITANMSIPAGGGDGDDKAILLRYDNLLMRNSDGSVTAWTQADRFRLFTGSIYISISNIDSGWVDAVNPNANVVKALMNGWKSTANNGTAYTSWVSIIDGSAPATNTEAWVAANKAPGWTAWATLDYALASAVTPVIIPNAEGSITLHPGGNQISVETGVIQREKVVPKLDSGSYYIISQSSTNYWGNAKLRHPARVILAVFKGAENDTRNWTFTPDTYGGLNARTLPANYDASADYYVTYSALDKYALTANVTDTASTWRTGLGGVTSDLVQSVAELRQADDRQDFADDYIEAKVDNLKVDISNGSVLPDNIQKHKLTLDNGTLSRYTGDLNDLIDVTRMYYCNSGSTNKPPGYTEGPIEVFRLVDSTNRTIQRAMSATDTRMWVRMGVNGTWTSWFKIWGENAQGAGSGLEADLLDGLQGVNYVQTKTVEGNADLNTVITAGIWRLAGSTMTNHPGPNYYYGQMLVMHAPGTDTIIQVVYPYTGFGPVYRRGNPSNVGGSGGWSVWFKMWTEENDGAGSGLDADLHAGKTLAEVVQGFLAFAVTTGTAPALSAGLRVSIKAHAATTGPVTLNLNGLGAKSIKKPNGNNPPLALGGVYTVVYDGTNFTLQGEGGEYGTATALQVLAGYSIGTDAGLIPGTMANRANDQLSTTMWTDGAGNFSIGFPTGAYVTNSGFGAGYASATVQDADFVANNFPNDKNIFGLQGSMPRQSAYTAPASTAWDGNYMYVRIPQGAYQTAGGSGYPEIQLSAAQARADGNIVAGNIRNGAWIYGVQGNLVPDTSGIIGVDYYGYPGAWVEGTYNIVTVPSCKYFIFGDRPTTNGHSSIFTYATAGSPVVNLQLVDAGGVVLTLITVTNYNYSTNINSIYFNAATRTVRLSGSNFAGNPDSVSLPGNFNAGGTLTIRWQSAASGTTSPYNGCTFAGNILYA
ncbi:hypothetical protein QW71_00740 [Paenibacillus sp. IHB B 3415]|uniref:pyocin knob domain-containing protein n=1 Tax=Paenibacillus sp. IHB B 3415 TaxID=867080 RepID=UPI000574A468|nr:pyocin knob domain-containing protein [Paenibacillus sp. IHB B 3415]KHL97369.1 hypothetical protein QW71_00740 [Paenibacillus sp. IHB B 3415]